MLVFDGRQYNLHEQNVVDLIKGAARDIDSIFDFLPQSREKDITLMKLEECVMWAQKAINLHGLK